MADADLPLAHIVHPGQKMRDLLGGKGQRVKALCGSFVTRRPAADDPVCRWCFVEYRKLEEKADAEEGSQKASV